MDTLARGLRACPKARGGGQRVSTTRRTGLCAALIFVLGFLPVSAQGQKDDVSAIGKRDINKRSLNFYSIEKEIALGQQLSRQVEMTSSLLRDREVVEYVDGVVQRIVRNSDAYVPFTVRVIDSGDINAFALPGGFLYVNTGLIVEAQTEAEFAGILAHEIAHVTARHATKQKSKATIFQWATLPLLFLGGPAGAALQQGLGLAGPLTFLKFARGHEREADQLGLQYAYRSGYDPTGLIDILERLGDKRRENQLSKIFSTHPMNKDRIKRAQKGIADGLPAQPEYVVSTARFDWIRARLARRLRNQSLYEPGKDGPRLRRRTQD